MTCPWLTITVNQRKVYFSLCIIKYFLNIISPNNDMKAKIDALLSAYPSIDVTAMGSLADGRTSRCGNKTLDDSKTDDGTEFQQFLP